MIGGVMKVLYHWDTACARCELANPAVAGQQQVEVAAVGGTCDLVGPVYGFGELLLADRLQDDGTYLVVGNGRVE